MTAAIERTKVQTDPRRSQFAAMAMQGMLARGGAEPQQIAKMAIRYADALIAQLEE